MWLTAFGFSQGFQVSTNDSTLVLIKDGAVLLSYRHALLPPPDGQAAKWARSGFIHPLYSPSGEVLTWVQPPDHLHHMGIWNPWTHVTWTTPDGEQLLTDFWNLGDESGTVSFKEILETAASDQSAGFVVAHDHMAFVPAGRASSRQEIKVLEEKWMVTVSRHPKGYIMDFTSLIRNVREQEVSLDAYRYGGGIGFRATEQWNDNNSRVMTSEGKTRADGDATRAKWAAISGDLNGKETGLLFMSVPSNYDYPQPMRIWPPKTNGVGHQFFEFTPIREKAWILKPGKTYSQKYRILVYEGRLTAEEAEQCWQNYVQPRVLVYTRNGEGFVHDNIAASVEMLQKICERNRISCDVTDDPSMFTALNLSRYQAVIFSNTNNEAFATDDQRQAFQAFIQGGGGFVGIHSACGSERNWPWFWKMLGGTFVKHPPYQQFDVKVIQANHPSTAHLPATWAWEDEAYYLHHLYPGIQVLLAHDLTTIEDPGKAEYPGTLFGDLYPGAWCQKFDGGVEWYTTYGHSIKHYSDPNYIKHIEGGLLWVLEEVAQLNN